MILLSGDLKNLDERPAVKYVMKSSWIFFTYVPQFATAECVDWQDCVWSDGVHELTPDKNYSS